MNTAPTRDKSEIDAALALKRKVDSGEIAQYDDARPWLERSRIVRALLADFPFDVLNAVNRLTEIAEIPFAGAIEKVQRWVSELADRAACPDGFSLTGKSDDMLSCYNAMIASVLIRLDYPDRERIRNGIEWILKHQNTRRGAENTWPGSRALKYGGCLQATPCYLGVAKSMVALSDFKRGPNYLPDARLEAKLESGLEYMLSHQLYLRLSDGLAITADISKLSYPFSYKTNVVEILRLMARNGLDLDQRCAAAKAFLASKKQTDGHWRVNSVHLPKHWIVFDAPKAPGRWLSSEIEKLTA